MIYFIKDVEFYECQIHFYEGYMVFNNIFVFHSQAMLIKCNNPKFTIEPDWFHLGPRWFVLNQNQHGRGVPRSNDVIT